MVLVAALVMTASLLVSDVGALATPQARAAAHAVDPARVASLAGGRPASAPAGIQAASLPSVTPGYWLLASDGGVYQYGTAYQGSMRGLALAQPIVGMTSDATGGGYWMVASDGGIFAFGDAGYFGSMGARPLARPIVAMAATATGRGYWLVASDGGIFAFGDAGFFGSMGARPLARPIVGMAATPSGHGYWLVASDGGIFAFGDAGFSGSEGGRALARPIVGMAANPAGGGYWLVASDGGIFAFGAANFAGSTGGIHLANPVVGMAANPAGGGYWLVASDGGIFAYGTAPFFGSAGGRALPFPVIAMASTRLGSPYPQTATGYDISFPQCDPKGQGISLPPSTRVAVVGVNDGLSHNAAGTDIDANPCFQPEAAWGGPGLTVYINVDGVPAGDQPASAHGPAGNCAAGDLLCEGYNWGWDGAVRDVAYVHGLGYFPNVWWLDVEAPCHYPGSGGPLWRCASPTDPTQIGSNARVVQGAIDGLRASGVIPGIYSTYLQFPDAVGPSYAPGTPIWIAGASDVANAAAYCADTTKRFAGGRPWLVQYGFAPAPQPTWDPDYACPLS